MQKKIRGRFISLLCAGLLALPALARAQEDIIDDETISVYAKACEPLRPGEARSGVRVRATDKAGFKSVENISALSDIRSQTAPHDFNVLVYNLVDNYLEDMAVRTLEQSSEQICVEVTGYLSPANIDKAYQSLLEKQKQQAEENRSETTDEDFQALEIESDDLPEAVTALPPKPQPKIRDEIAYETAADSPAAPAAETAADNKTAVFVERTKFYNGSETGGFFDNIKKALGENPGIKATTSKTGADYVLNTKVLRARVDPINQKTNRLQMVVQLELIETETGTAITEHQNRFILFESSEDEQKVASGLMQKLLEKGCRRLLPKIKTPQSAEQRRNNAVITPARPQV